MSISEHEKKQVVLIDKQVLLLQDKGASDAAILDALIDFIPDAACIINRLEQDNVSPLLSKYYGFSYFVSLIEQAAALD